VSKVDTYQVILHGDKVHGDGDGHVMMVIKLQREKKKDKNKNQVLIKANVSNMFLFWHSRHHKRCECI